jgi:hypothetical protein
MNVIVARENPIMTPIQSRPPCRCAAGKPSLQELLDDPTIQLLMERDGVRMEDLVGLLGLVRKRLIAEPGLHVA